MSAGPRRIELTDIKTLFDPMTRVFIPGAAGEPVPVIDELYRPDATPLDIENSFLPGVNRPPATGLPEGSVCSGLFSFAADSPAQVEGRYRHIAQSYGSYVERVKAGPAFDVCIAQVAPPDENGRCSLGVSVEFTKMVAARAKRLLLCINHQMPRIPGADSFALDEADWVVEFDAPLREYDVGTPSDEATAIARHVAGLVEDGAILQFGIGKVPDAFLNAVSDRKNLKLYSGMLSDGTMKLVAAGALDPDFEHTCALQLGTQPYYDWLKDRSGFRVTGCDRTHSLRPLMDLGGFIGVNSAIEVDLLGQANLEMTGGRMVSGPGGAPDFTRAASLCPDAISVIGLPATAKRGEIAKIVPKLSGPATLPRWDIDMVVTEIGIADLRGVSTMERAERLIEVAAPQHRADLTDAWREMAKRI